MNWFIFTAIFTYFLLFFIKFYFVNKKVHLLSALKKPLTHTKNITSLHKSVRMSLMIRKMSLMILKKACGLIYLSILYCVLKLYSFRLYNSCEKQ